MSGKGEILNDAEVDFLLSTAGNDEPQAPASAPPGDSQTVTMRGDLEQINLADIFQTLAMSKMEGVLHVRNPLEERQVYCCNGSVRIKVPPRVAVRRLGQRLVHAGLLEPEQLRVALVAQRRERLPLGELLVKQGLLTQDQIDAVAGMQVAEDLFALFTWRHGSFEFYKGELADQQQRAQFEVCPEFEVNSLLLEVARRSDEWESILAAIGSLDEVPARLAEPADDAELSDAHRAILYGADGQNTYRELAEQTTLPLFDMARAARDLVKGNLLGNVDDAHLVAVAAQRIADAQEKRALLLLQTLRDRPGDRSLETVTAMAAALEKAGERRLAGIVLLEAAQLQTSGKEALALARRARDLAPNDAGTISFLRTTLIAHSDPKSAELEKCTLDLLDALIEADLTTTALEIVEDARATGTIQPQILLREARARQKARDVQGALKVMLELAAAYEATGDRSRTIEAYESILKMDRSRKDIQKLLTHLRQTRMGRIVRSVAAALCVLLLGGMGLVFWQQTSFEAKVQQADAEIAALLGAGDRSGARERWQHWQGQLGDCEPVEDLRSRIDFAEATEQSRLEKAARQRVNEALKHAGSKLGDGDLPAAFADYQGLWRDPALRQEVAGVVDSRLDAVLGALEQANKAMAHRLPQEPSYALDRRELADNLAYLQSICPPALLRTFRELHQMHDAGSVPELVTELQRQRIAALLPQAKGNFARAEQLAAAYTEALQRNEHQRRLDPMFKEAVTRESAHDFAGALELYRQLEKEPASDSELRAHFRDQVARNATICRLMDALRAATEASDFGAAQQQFRALRLAFPELPFEKLVRLPLRVESLPSGADVTCNGKVVGQTPLVVSYVPAEETKVSVSLGGFRGTSTSITGDTIGRWTGHLVLEPSSILQMEARIEVPPADDGEGRLFFVDRGGAIRAIAEQDGRQLWHRASGDLSGLLSRPFVHGAYVVVASLDGDLRALDRRTGEVAWSLPNLPSEIEPALVDKYLLLATTDRRLHSIDLEQRTSVTVQLPEAGQDTLLAQGSTIVTIGERGTATAYSLPALQQVWQASLGLTQPLATLAGTVLVACDDHGHVRCVQLATGNVRWTKDLDVETLGRPVVCGADVLLSSPDRILRFDLDKGSQRPPIEKVDQSWTDAPRRVGNRLVVPVSDGSLQVLDAGTGLPLYRIDGSKRGGCVVAQDTRLYVVQADRRVHCFPVLR